MLGLVLLCMIVKSYCQQYFNYIVAYINLTLDTIYHIWIHRVQLHMYKIRSLNFSDGSHWLHR